jgi:hypothetical protein
VKTRAVATGLALTPALALGVAAASWATRSATVPSDPGLGETGTTAPTESDPAPARRDHPPLPSRSLPGPEPASPIASLPVPPTPSKVTPQGRP